MHASLEHLLETRSRAKAWIAFKSGLINTDAMVYYLK